MDKDDKIISNSQEDADFQKALEALENSKTVKIKDKKSKEDSFIAKFSAKCAKDKIIPLCLILMVLFAAGAILYFTLPVFFVPSFDMTVDQFRDKYTQTEIYSKALADYNCQIPPVEYIEYETTTSVALTADPSPDSESDADKDTHPHERYFSSVVNTTAAEVSVAVQGRSRNVDGELTGIRVLIQYVDDPGMFDFLRVFYSSYLQVFCPELSATEAYALTGDSLYQIKSDNYMTVGNVAFKSSMVDFNGMTCIAFDIVPAESLD